MTRYYKRSATGPDAAGTQSATIPLGYGVYEVVYCHLMVGGPVPIVGARLFIGGQVHFQSDEELNESVVDMKRAQRIMSHANFTDFRPYVSHDHVTVIGPGRFKSFVEFPTGYTAEHTMTMIYRRVDDY